MKKLLASISFAILLFLNGWLLAWAAMSDNNVSYWKMEDNVNDSIATNHGTATSITYSASGKIGKAAIYNAATDRISTQDAAGMQCVNGTMSIWFNSDAQMDGTTHDEANFWTKGNTYIGFFKRWSVFPDGKIHFIHYAGTLRDLPSTTTTWSADTWYHLVASWGAAGGKFYVNGVLEDTDGATDNYTDTSDVWEIGSRAGVDSFRGRIDEASFWCRQLSNDEVVLLYNQGNGWQTPYSATTSPATAIPVYQDAIIFE